MNENANPQELSSPEERDEKIRRVDEIRWLSTRYAPRNQRADLIALYALDHELQRALTMSEPMLGRIRVQWWREVFEQIESGGDIRKHDLALDLGALAKRVEGILPRLNAMLDAYDQFIDDGQKSVGPDHPILQAGGRLAECAGLCLGASDKDDLNNLRQCGAAWAAVNEKLEQGAYRLKAASAAFKALPSELTPAVAHICLAPSFVSEKPPGPLGARWKIFRTVMFGRV